MKNLKTLTTMTLLMLVSFAHAESLEDILAKNITTRGGEIKLKNIQTLRIKGKSTAGGMEFPIIIIQKRPNLVRMEVTVQNQTIVQAFDGKTAWWIVPFMNIFEPQEMPEKEAKQFRDQIETDIDSPFLDYKKKGYQIELLGEDKLEGTDVYKVKVTRASGRELTYYLDKGSGLELKVVVPQEQQGQSLAVETSLGDFQEVDGVLFPFSIQSSVNGKTAMQMVVESIEINQEIKDDFFQFKSPETPQTPTQPQ